MKKAQLLPIIILGFFIIPSVAMASWWNPFSWFKKNTMPIEQPTVQVEQINVPVVVDKKIPTKTISNGEKKTTKKISTSVISPVINTPTTPSALSTGGGASPVVMVGPCPILGPCTAPPVIINNSTSNQILPENAGCDSGTSFSSITGMPCGGTTTVISTTTPIVPSPTTSTKKQNKIQPTIISTPTPPPTYKELHCPQITIIKDSLGNIGHSPFQGAGIKSEFSKETVNSITLEITATDPQGLPVYFRISSDWPNDSTYDWSLKNTYTFDVSNSSKGVHIVAIEIDNHDDFNCLSGRGDALRQLEYSVY